MSNYTDRSISTAYASDSAWSRFIQQAYDAARIASVATVCIGANVVDTARASDEVQARGYVIAESVAQISDEVTAQRNSLVRTADAVRVFDRVRAGSGAQIADEVGISDTVRVGIRVRTQDNASIFDQAEPQRSTLVRSQDTLKIKDRAYARFGIQYADELQVSDTAKAQLHIRAYAVDTLKVSDLDFSSIQSRSNVVDIAKVSDSVWAKVQVTARSEDVLYIRDEYPRIDSRAQAWVASINRFAMSRYDPFNFDGLTVINGQLYGWNDQGVFLCGVEGEQIQATLETGKLDFSESLVHPLAYFMEYQLRGESKAIAVTVGTTQSGNLQQYTYNLPAENANELTNGRVQFGRGLRGRHFSFKIQLQGTAATLNAQSVDFSPTSRRI